MKIKEHLINRSNSEQMVTEKDNSFRHNLIMVVLIAAVIFFLGTVVSMGFLMLVQMLIDCSQAEVQFLLEYYVVFIGIDVLVLVFCFFFEPDIYQSMKSSRRGGGRGNNWKMLSLGFLIGFCANVFCAFCACLSKDLAISFSRINIAYLICAFFAVLIQSGAEELVTRGYILGALSKRYPAWVGILMNGLFFGVMHLLNPGVTIISFFNILMFGVVTAMAVKYFDCLWLCIALHTAWNYTQNLLLGLPNSGVAPVSSMFCVDAVSDSIIYDAAFGLEGGIVWTILECTAFIVLLLWGPSFSNRKRSIE